MAKLKHDEKDIAVPGGPKGLRQRGKGPSYYFLRQYRGKRPKISLGSSLSQARMAAQQIINSLERGDFKLSEYQVGRAGIVDSLTDAVDRLGIRAQHSPKSRASYMNRVNQFVAFLSDRYPKALFLDDLTPDIGHEYVEWRRQQLVTRSGKAKPNTPRNHPSVQTIHDDVRRLRALFRVAKDDHLIEKNPFEGVKITVKASDRKAPLRSLTEKEVKALLLAAKKYDAAPNGGGAISTFRGMMHDIIQFYLLTGLRKEELIYLPWSHVDLDWESTGKIEIKPVDEAVTLRIAPNRAQVERIREILVTRKSRMKLFGSVQQMQSCVACNYAKQETKALMAITVSAWDDELEVLHVPTRIHWKQKATPGPIPLIAKSRAILKRQRAANSFDSPFVFPHPDCGPLRSDPLPQFKLLLIDAKLPKSTRLHDLRHTFGFTLRKREVPLETIMGLMRHANIEETMVYAKYSLDEGAKRIQCLQELW
jgi:integrase